MFFLSQGSLLSCYHLRIVNSKIELISVPFTFEPLDSLVLDLHIQDSKLLIVTEKKIYEYSILMIPLPQLQLLKCIDEYQAIQIGLCPTTLNMYLLEKDGSVILE